MYGLPDSFDGSFFLGRKLELLCFSLTQVYLHFDCDVMISVDGAYSIRGAVTAPVSQLKGPVAEPLLFSLLEHFITKADAINHSVLSLTFDNGAIFECYDLDERFEAYQIKNGSNIMIV